MLTTKNRVQIGFKWIIIGCFCSSTRSKWLYRSRDYRLNFFNFLTP